MELLGSQGSLIKLWLYFESNIDGYSFDFSPKDCEKWGKGMSRTVVQDNLKILKNLGYIVEQDGKYIFYEIPVKYQF